jgi:hypothetical protein
VLDSVALRRWQRIAMLSHRLARARTPAQALEQKFPYLMSTKRNLKNLLGTKTKGDMNSCLFVREVHAFQAPSRKHPGKASSTQFLCTIVRVQKPQRSSNQSIPARMVRSHSRTSTCGVMTNSLAGLVYVALCKSDHELGLIHSHRVQRVTRIWVYPELMI